MTLILYINYYLDIITPFKIILVAVLLLVLILLILYILFRLKNGSGSALADNAPDYLNITTYDGSGQCVHPDIIYTPTGWHGYHYILAYTPYPFENEDYENPCIRVSNDRMNWTKFEGQPDPIVAAPRDGEKKLFYADPNIVLTGSELTLFYASDHIYYTTSINPAIWGQPVQTDLPAIMSPSFRYNGSAWECWGIDLVTLKLRHFQSSNKINWSESGNVSCEIPGHITWHSNVKRTDDAYYALIVGQSPRNKKLFLLKSVDGLIWTMDSKKPLLVPSTSGWDNSNIYASTFIKAGNKLMIWYSSQSKENQWHIGYTEYNLPVK